MSREGQGVTIYLLTDREKDLRNRSHGLRIRSVSSNVNRILEMVTGPAGLCSTYKLPFSDAQWEVITVAWPQDPPRNIRRFHHDLARSIEKMGAEDGSAAAKSQATRLVKRLAELEPHQVLILILEGERRYVELIKSRTPKKHRR